MISVKTIWIAIFRILKSAGLKPGGSILLSDLMSHWQDTRLRQGDLAHGLDTLTRANLVSLEMSEQGPQVTLLSDKFSTTVALDDGNRVVRSLEQLSFVRGEAARSKSTNPDEHLTRRSGDAARRRQHERNR